MDLPALFFFVIAVLITSSNFVFSDPDTSASRLVYSPGRYQDLCVRPWYSPNDLKALRYSSNVQKPITLQSNDHACARRKRGRKGGVKARARRRRHLSALPTVVLSNARSLNNKMDELQASCKYLHQYRDASFLCITETWFNMDLARPLKQSLPTKFLFY